MRTVLAATILGATAALSVPPHLAAQGNFFLRAKKTLADSLAFLEFPTNPLDFPAAVKNEEGWNWMVFNLFEMGCPSDGGWAGQAFDAMEDAARTDPELRTLFHADIGSRLGVDLLDPAESQCPDDHGRIIRLLTTELRRQHETKGSDLNWDLLTALEAADNADSYAAVRAIVHDTTLHEHVREYAIESLSLMRQRMYGETHMEAFHSVEAEMRKAGVYTFCPGIVFCRVGKEQPPPKR